MGDYRCITYAEAQAAIEDNDLTVGTVDPPDSAPTDLVVAQDPAPGTQVLPGTPVNLGLAPPPVDPCPPG